jgi:hypothetical protein
MGHPCRQTLGTPSCAWSGMPHRLHHYLMGIGGRWPVADLHPVRDHHVPIAGVPRSAFAAVDPIPPSWLLARSPDPSTAPAATSFPQWTLVCLAPPPWRHLDSSPPTPKPLLNTSWWSSSLLQRKVNRGLLIPNCHQQVPGTHTRDGGHTNEGCI